MEKEIRARVFISCGQAKGTDEVEIADKIAEKLHDMGFDPYVAITEHSLRGVKENIFARLSESEYFIFIDFKRERLFTLDKGSFSDTGKYRGSLFSHQELAIATFLDIEALSFREKDVKEDDGILKFIQANCIEFTDRHLLPDVVAEKVRERGWNPNWRNELLLERDGEDFQDVRYVGGKERPARFYHIRVKNIHEDRIARDCVAYLEGIKIIKLSRVEQRLQNILAGETKSVELVEFKWKGVNTPRVAIPPKEFRYLDALHIYYDSQNTVHLGINPFLVDFSGYYELYTLRGTGTFELTYVVFSENFSPARATFGLHIGNQLADIQFYTKEQCGGVA